MSRSLILALATGLVAGALLPFVCPIAGRLGWRLFGPDRPSEDLPPPKPGYAHPLTAARFLLRVILECATFVAVTIGGFAVMHLFVEQRAARNGPYLLTVVVVAYAITRWGERRSALSSLKRP